MSLVAVKKWGHFKGQYPRFRRQSLLIFGITEFSLCHMQMSLSNLEMQIGTTIPILIQFETHFILIHMVKNLLQTNRIFKFKRRARLSFFKLAF